MKAIGKTIRSMDKVTILRFLFLSLVYHLGTLIMTSGDVYTGSFSQDAMEGEGIMIYHNGDRYKGEFSQNKRHGIGKCLYKNGDRYKGSSIVSFELLIDCDLGEWKHDTRHGYGTCRFHDGIKFKGQWRHDHWIQTSAAPSKTIVTGEALSKAFAGHKATFQIEVSNQIRH